MSEVPPTSRVKVGMISFRQTNVECTIRAISAFGATLMVPSPTRIPDEFVLVVGSGQKSCACNVVKRSGISIGVVFVPLGPTFRMTTDRDLPSQETVVMLLPR